MGNRVKGREKKKGIKAAIGSNAGSKRKLSRMGKKQKKEHSGLDASFIGRSACIKMLQISIKDFRRLCILKGIYPREPLGNRVPGKKKGQTYYHVKDIRAIAHEPILEKFREFRSFMKKVRRAAGRNESNEAQRINSILPTYNLNRLVKERYPRFIDAVSDMDDALTLTYLFAALPAAHERNLEAKLVQKAKKIAAAWGAYCATTSAITKSFISVKGIYMEAEIHNCSATPVRWIIPHAFTQYLPDDVDFRVMNTFLEFYDTLLNFILYKLYSDIGVRYPFNVKDLGSEHIGSTSALLGANLRALTNALNPSNGGTIGMIVSESVRANSESTELVPKTKSEKKKSKELVQSVAAALQTLKSDEDDDEDEDVDEDVDIAGPLQAALENAAEEEARALLIGGGANSTMNYVIDDEELLKRKRLFAGLTFFMSREVPRGYLELVALAFGAKIGWEGNDSPISMKDPSITHHIIDRPTIPSSYESSLPKSREYVQPQWIVDCTNFMYLLPITRYGVGMTLPPHLSPWVDDEEEGYKPKYAEEVERLKNGESIDDIDDTTGEHDISLDHATTAMSKHIEELVDEMPEEDKVDEEEDEEEDDDDSEVGKEKNEKKRKLEEEEAHRLAKTMMSRKASHLYGRMQHGLAKQKAKIESLNQRRKELIVDPKDKGKERDGLGRLIITGKEKDDTGKTVNKLKVERLKEERKSLESTYNKSGGTMKKNKRSRP